MYTYGKGQKTVETQPIKRREDAEAVMVFCELNAKARKAGLGLGDSAGSKMHSVDSN